MCDAGYIAHFDKKYVRIINYGADILVGKGCFNTGLLQVPLTNKVGNQTKNNTSNAQFQCNNVHQKTSILNLMAYLHVAAFSRVVSTWLVDVWRGFFQGWSVLATINVNKYFLN